MSTTRGVRLLMGVFALAMVVIIARNLYVRHSRNSFIEAVEKNDVKGVRYWLAKGWSPNTIYHDATAISASGMSGMDFSVLYLATVHCSADVAEVLLAHGAKYNADDMERAVNCGCTKVAALFLDRGMSPNTKEAHSGVEYHSYLCAAVTRDNTELAEIFLNRGGDPNAKIDQNTPILMFAAMHKNTALVKSLLSHGAEVDARDPGGSTAFLQASDPRRLDIAKILLAAHAQVDAKQHQGWTALMFAAQGGRTEVIKFLVANGADVNVRNNDGDTPLTVAAKGKHAAAVQLLKSLGARE